MVRRILVVGLFLGCMSAPLRGEAQTLPASQLPMYGGVEKTEAMRKADEAFIAKIAQMGLTREQGSRKSAELGWKYLFQGDLATAMARFNQAWLLNPENGDAFHGFAVITAQRNGSPQEAETYFKAAISKPGIAPGAFVDYARLLNMLGRHDEAIAQGRRALAISPAARNARMQISYAFISKKDAAQACDWGRKAKENGDAIVPPDYLGQVCKGK